MQVGKKIYLIPEFKTECTSCGRHDDIYYTFQFSTGKIVVSECAECADSAHRFDEVA